MMTTTPYGRFEKIWDELGTLRFAARLQGEEIDTVEVTVDREWTEDSETYRYTIECMEASNGCDEYEEARYIVADMIRTLRNGTMDERAERDNDSARDFVESLIEQGDAALVLKALRAAKLI